MLPLHHQALSREPAPIAIGTNPSRFKQESGTGFEPVVSGFADQCLTIWLPRLVSSRGVEPAFADRMPPLASAMAQAVSCRQAPVSTVKRWRPGPTRRLPVDRQEPDKHKKSPTCIGRAFQNLLCGFVKSYPYRPCATDIPHLFQNRSNFELSCISPNNI